MRGWAIGIVLLLLLPSGIHALSGLPTAGPIEAWIWSPNAESSESSLVLDLVGELELPFHEYGALDMVAFLGTKQHADWIATQTGGDVERNEHYDLDLKNSVPAIEADVVAKAVGAKRFGPSVLIIDTGVDSLHPDFQDGNLAHNIAAERMGGLVVGVQAPDVVVDEDGHGTHVAGIVAGSGAASGSSDPLHNDYRGVYFNGRIVGFQALAENSDGDSAQVDTLAALEAMDWAIENGEQYKVRVIQSSWGTGGDLDPRSSVTKATLDLYLAGMTVVFSAGNLGTEEEALNKFCQAPWILCVANVDNRGGLAESSSVGTSSGTYRPYAHPDLAAPGTLITAPGSFTNVPPDAFSTTQSILDSEPSKSLYAVRTGTSMAAPHVSGAAAQLLAANPDLSPDQVMDILVETASASVHSMNQVGAGMINLREAYNLAVQTPGNRAAFVAGEQVKYGGPATGDDTYSVDSTTLGYTSTPTGNAVILQPGQDFIRDAESFFQSVGSQITEEMIQYAIIGLVILLIIIWAVGIPRRRRRRRERREIKRQAKMARKAAKSAPSAPPEAVSFVDVS